MDSNFIVMPLLLNACTTNNKVVACIEHLCAKHTVSVVIFWAASLARSYFLQTMVSVTWMLSVTEKEWNLPLLPTSQFILQLSCSIFDPQTHPAVSCLCNFVRCLVYKSLYASHSLGFTLLVL